MQNYGYYMYTDCFMFSLPASLVPVGCLQLHLIRTYGLMVATSTLLIAGWRHALRSEWPFIIVIIA